MHFIFVTLLQVIIIEASYIDVLKNSDASASALQNSLISNVKINSKFMCLSECTKRSDCGTAVYHTIDLNCFLFKDQLGPNDIVASTCSNLYLKKNSKLRLRWGNGINKLVSFI